MALRPDLRDLPIKRTARQLVHQLRGEAEKLNEDIELVDAPASREGAIHLRNATGKAENIYDLSFMATEKLTEQEETISSQEQTIARLRLELQTADVVIAEWVDRNKKKGQENTELERRLMRHEITD